MPSGVSGDLGAFDRFAAAASAIVGRAPFFACCVGLVVIWAPSYFIFRDIETWQLIINTATTIITFLLVALLENSQHRADLAVQNKLNAIAEGLADLMDVWPDLECDQAELRAAVGLEARVSSTDD